MNDNLALLHLYAEWGIDLALDDHPPNRLLRGEQIKTEGIESPSRVKNNPAIQSVRTSDPGTKYHHIIHHKPDPLSYAKTLCAVTTDLPTLFAHMKAFTIFYLCETATHTVLPQGKSERIGVFIIGDIPDEDEDRTGIIFNSQKGKMIGYMLNSIGLSLADVIIAPLIPWRPPGGRLPSQLEMDICLLFLHAIIRLSRPDVLVPMGIRATRFITGMDSPLSRLHGKVIEVKNSLWLKKINVLPMRYPTQLEASITARKEMWQDMLTLKFMLKI